MKRLMTITVFGMCLLMAVPMAYAGKRGGGGNGRWACSGKAWGNVGAGGGYNYVDENGDGICDNAPRNGKGRGLGRGAKDGSGPLNPGGRGRGFVDEDGDGICDNAGTGRNLKKTAGANR